MIILSIVIGIVSAVIGIGTYSTYKNEKRGLKFVEDILNDNVVFKRDVNGEYYAKQDDFILRVKKDGRFIDINLENNFFSGGKYHYAYSVEYDLSKGRKQVLRKDSSLVRNESVLFERLTQKIVNADWENFDNVQFSPQEDFGEKEETFYENVTPVEIDFEEREIQEKANEIKDYYLMIKEEKNSPLDMEDRHNLDRLYTKDFVKLSIAYNKLKEKGEIEKEKMLEALGLILGKMKTYEEKNEHARKNEFEKVVETIRSRK